MTNKEMSNGSLATTGATTDSIDAQLNPFALHYSFMTTTALVTQPLLGASNYGSWSRAMMMTLSKKNKSGFIKGTIKKLETEDKLLTA